MPRRIPDYPDAFYGWNYISSLGSFISVGATVTFLVVVYRAMTSRAPAATNTWAVAWYFTEASLDEDNSVRSPTLEWTVPAPTPMHAYNMLPLQS